MTKREFLRILGFGTLGLANSHLLFSQCTAKKPGYKNWAWISAGKDDTAKDWKQIFAKMKQHSVDAALVLADKKTIESIIPVAQETGIELHNWIVAVRCGDEEIKKNHPEWFMISRNGDSTLDKPPYVPYYTWLCPSRVEVQEHLQSRVAELSELEGLKGIHLDYIRYPDVILPIGIQPKYNLVQDKEYAEFDFCYCSVCREQFKKQEGMDPLELEDPSTNQAWLQYRYNQITNLVNSLVPIAQQKGKILTAAVFPSPSIARKLVRQDWPKWNLDAFMPMMYHEYYNEDINWIKKVTEEGVEDLAGKAKLYSGFFVKWLNPEELSQATQMALQVGASGIVLFTGTAMTDEQWQSLKKTMNMV